MKKVKLIWWIFTLVPIVLLALGYIYPSSFFSNQEQIRDYINSFGVFSPLALVVVQIVQVILTPISHYVVGIAGGFLFGTWPGFILNWIGRVVGTLIAFYLGRKLGRRVVKHVVKQETLQKYDKVFDKGKLILFIMYFLPLFPDDELSYLAGISAMSPKAFIPIMMIGHIGGSLGLAYVGNGLSYKDPVFIILSIVSLIFGVMFVLWYKRQSATVENNEILPKN